MGRTIIRSMDNMQMPQSVKEPAVKLTTSKKEQGTRAKQSCRSTIT